MIVLFQYTVHNGIISSILHAGLSRLLLISTVLGNIGVTIMIVCFIIDLIRKETFERLFSKIYDKIFLKKSN